NRDQSADGDIDVQSRQNRVRRMKRKASYFAASHFSGADFIAGLKSLNSAFGAICGSGATILALMLALWSSIRARISRAFLSMVTAFSLSSLSAATALRFLRPASQDFEVTFHGNVVGIFRLS